MNPPARRLTLSPIGFDIVLALSQTPAGLRLADLAHVIGSPVSSVQTALRILVANQIVTRQAVEPPRYRLDEEHPAREELVSLAAVLPEPAHAIGVVLRANPTVGYAAVDALGFIASEVARSTDEVARAALDHVLLHIATSRPEAPAVMRMTDAELERLIKVAVGLRARAQRATTIKGRSPAPGNEPDRGGSRDRGTARRAS
jgi:hypothetical protein